MNYLYYYIIYFAALGARKYPVSWAWLFWRLKTAGILDPIIETAITQEGGFKKFTGEKSEIPLIMFLCIYDIYVLLINMSSS